MEEIIKQLTARITKLEREITELRAQQAEFNTEILEHLDASVSDWMKCSSRGVW